VVFLVASAALDRGLFRFDLYKVESSHILKLSNTVEWEKVFQYGHGLGNGTQKSQDMIPYMNQTFVTWTSGTVSVLALNLTAWCICWIDHESDSISMYGVYDHSLTQTLYLNESQLPAFVGNNRTDFWR
jgi:hypothetical protein